MTNIDVRPEQLRDDANKLIEYSNAIQSAWNNVQNEVQRFKPAFRGELAATVIDQYERLNESTKQWPTVLTAFANWLQNAADQFARADSDVDTLNTDLAKEKQLLADLQTDWSDTEWAVIRDMFGVGASVIGILGLALTLSCPVTAGVGCVVGGVLSLLGAGGMGLVEEGQLGADLDKMKYLDKKIKDTQNQIAQDEAKIKEDESVMPPDQPRYFDPAPIPYVPPLNPDQFPNPLFPPGLIPDPRMPFPEPFPNPLFPPGPTPDPRMPDIIPNPDLNPTPPRISLLAFVY